MPLARLLVVEDDAPIAKLLRQFLEGESFETATVACGEEAIALARAAPPDLIVLDLMLPGMDGVETCLALREFYLGPVLMLTAHEGEMQEVIALNAGVDDFLHKPIRPHVLKARIHALLRRHAPPPSALAIAGFRIERERRRVFFNDEAVELSESEFELLWALASRAGDVVPRDALFQRLRSKEYDGLDRSIDMRVSKLRKKLAAYTDRELIRTLRQLGYIFVKD
ncbi:MAG: response regulator transcription factor [Gammaproteobacteria bacterium]|nr:response regulator transcription factor [Gammaproteobacteria bacterium]